MWNPRLRDNSFDFTAQINPDPAAISATLDRALRIDASQLAAQPPGTVVAVRAVVRPGPQGPLRAPLSGAECVWYRSAVVPGWGYTAVPDIALSDSTPVLEGGAVAARRSLRPSEEISTAPFLVGDGGGGVLSVNPLTADVDTDVLALDEVRRPRRISTRALVREWILPPGAAVLVLGTTDGRGRLEPGSGAVLVSTRTEEQVRARCQAGWSRYSHDVGRSVIRTERFVATSRRNLRYVIAVIVAAFLIFVLVVTLT